MKTFAIVAISSVLLAAVAANAHPRDWNGHRSGTSASQPNDIVRTPRVPYSARAYEPSYGERGVSAGIGNDPDSRIRSQLYRDRIGN
ncbi:hypothetical protein RA307_08215 [Xanthobacteraceae bacterium Astr-EGSB]|uniref:hypothetical protein n=1 Tax=Astrobacterium formosum TaxID=3069710 RepID=UPI0027B5F1E7|nr:hypothetical protein [Xanthobacteraceae bacterium Astr-EGSB]